jgi:hypothetical protein
MTSRPSFIRNRLRPGIVTIGDGRVWLEKREDLRDLTHDLAKEIGASVVETGLYGNEIESAEGYTNIVELDRVEPPMTAEEARQFGNRLVARWASAKIPGFCDTVLPLPEPKE